MTNIGRFIGLLLFIGICLAVGWFGSLVTTPAIPNWYAGLEKPSWTPPSWVFGPVWTALYILMGIAAWLVWVKRGFAGAPFAMTIFFVQLALNFLWSYTFFGLQMPGLAFAVIIVLWIAILATIIAFWRYSVAAGVLLIPYIAWVTYASTLNFGVWRMNP